VTAVAVLQYWAYIIIIWFTAKRIQSAPPVDLIKIVFSFFGKFQRILEVSFVSYHGKKISSYVGLRLFN
jgi:hypothetical protein